MEASMATEDFCGGQQSSDTDRKKNEKFYFELDNKIKVLLINNGSSSDNKVSVALDVHLGNFHRLIFLRIFSHIECT